MNKTHYKALTAKQKQFVVDAIEPISIKNQNVTVATLPFVSQKTVLHGLWWMKHYGDSTTKHRARAILKKLGVTPWGHEEVSLQTAD